MQQLRANERFRRVIERVDQLPAFPVVVSKLLEVINSAESSADDAAALIGKDPALTSKIVRLANSAFYGMPRSVSSVSSAVVILGFNSIRSLVLSASLMKMFPAHSFGGAFSYQSFWLHSITTAIGAKALVRHRMAEEPADPEGAFCAGMLHDIGRLILACYASKEYDDVCAVAHEKRVPLLSAESEVLGSTHAEIGRAVADRWALPTDLEYSIVHHHAPRAADKVMGLVLAVHLADAIAHEVGSGTSGDEVAPPIDAEACSGLIADQAELARVKDSVRDESKKAAEFFSIVS